MFRFGKDDFKLVDGLVSGAKTREFHNWNAIYNIFKVFGIAASGVALVYCGLSISFGIISASIFTGLLGVYQMKVMPAKKAKKNEDLAKQNLMLKIQSYLADSDVVIDGRSFRLERTATIDATKPVIVKEISVSLDGEEEMKDSEIMKSGNVTSYIKCSDDRNGLICWLKNIKSYVTEQQVTGQNRYETRMVARNCAFMLEDGEVHNLPQNGEFMMQTNAYDNSSVADITNVPATKVRKK